MDTLRISDADRESAVDLLSEQYALGRLSKDEFDERSDAVWSAKTQGDLAPIFVDLPVGSPVGSPRRGSVAQRRPRRWSLPLAPVVVALVALAVLTHLPFVLLLVVLFLGFGHYRHPPCGARR
jgi:Domain of unknown function (DUF1707)